VDSRIPDSRSITNAAISDAERQCEV